MSCGVAPACRRKSSPLPFYVFKHLSAQSIVKETLQKIDQGETRFPLAHAGDSLGAWGKPGLAYLAQRHVKPGSCLWLGGGGVSSLGWSQLHEFEIAGTPVEVMAIKVWGNVATPNLTTTSMADPFPDSY